MFDKIKKTVVVKYDDENKRLSHELVYLIYDSDVDSARDAASAFMVATRKHTPVAKTKYWIDPECIIPRFKFKTFCEKHKVQLVKKKDDADLIIYSENTLKTYFETLYYHVGYQYQSFYKTDLVEAFTKYLNHNKAGYKEVMQAIAESEGNHVIFDTYCKDQSYFKGLTDDFYEKSIDYNEKCQVVVIDQAYELLKDLTTNNSKYISENAIQAIMNDGTILDESDFRRLNDLFESGDYDNSKLAMEIMANCDFNKNAVYLLLLFMEHRGMMYNTPTRNHVNFKALLKFFYIDLHRGMDVDDVTSRLIKQNLLNKSNLDMLMPLVQELMKERSNMNNFTIKEIEPSQIVYESLSKNILDGELDTYIYGDEEESINPKTSL